MNFRAHSFRGRLFIVMGISTSSCIMKGDVAKGITFPTLWYSRYLLMRFLAHSLHLHTIAENRVREIIARRRENAHRVSHFPTPITCHSFYLVLSMKKRVAFAMSRDKETHDETRNALFNVLINLDVSRIRLIF